MAEKAIRRKESVQQSMSELSFPEKVSPTSGSKAVAATGTAERLSPFAITGVDQGTKKFTVAGDKTALFEEGDVFDIIDSTGNDGAYTVVASVAVAGPNTEIEVDKYIPDATVDGTIIADIPAKKIVFQADEDNTGDIYIGGSGADSDNGIVLTAGEVEVLDAGVNERFDLNSHWADVEVNGEKVRFNWYWR